MKLSQIQTFLGPEKHLIAVTLLKGNLTKSTGEPTASWGQHKQVLEE